MARGDVSVVDEQGSRGVALGLDDYRRRPARLGAMTDAAIAVFGLGVGAMLVAVAAWVGADPRLGVAVCAASGLFYSVRSVGRVLAAA